MKALPKKPAGVKYALTVPQSVLFADLSLQGNKREYFVKAMGIDYEPEYIAIDDGAMSWNHDDDKDFEEALLKEGSAIDAIEHFVRTMEETGKKLDEISKRDNGAGLTKALWTYWKTYKEHMTSLFTFWNVEKVLSDTLTAGLKKAGRGGEIEKGLTRFLKPDQPNYFVQERHELKNIAKKFNISPGLSVEDSPKELIEALEQHREDYGFLLAPFNLGEPPTVEFVLDRAKEFAGQDDSKDSDYGQDSFPDLPRDLQRLAKLAQSFTYQKTHRLDMFALADSRKKNLYERAAKVLSIKPDQLFAMTGEEILQSLRQNKPVVELSVIKERQKAYCLALIKGKIDFYKITKDKTQTTGEGVEVIKGVAASIGVAQGKVRVLKDLKEAKNVEKGEIIVTPMTRPEMGIALDRAVAFVTDEGGLLCHAAIISREMKKPCVIATGNATKILKTGDLIEVNGNTGVVTILKDNVQ